MDDRVAERLGAYKTAMPQVLRLFKATLKHVNATRPKEMLHSAIIPLVSSAAPSRAPAGSPRVLLLGGPGSGAQELPEQLALRHGVVNVSAGELLRAAALKGGSRAKPLKAFMRTGLIDTVPDEVVAAAVLSRRVHPARGLLAPCARKATSPCSGCLRWSPARGLEPGSPRRMRQPRLRLHCTSITPPAGILASAPLPGWARRMCGSVGSYSRASRRTPRRQQCSPRPASGSGTMLLYASAVWRSAPGGGALGHSRRARRAGRCNRYAIDTD